MKNDYSVATRYGPLRKPQFKKICPIYPSKHYPTIPCPPSGVSGGLHHLVNLQYTIPHTVFIVHKRCPQVKDCIETESSSPNGFIKRERARTRPHNPMLQQLMKPQPLRAPVAPNIPSCSPSSTLPLGRPLAVAPSLPRLAAGGAIPKLSLQ